MNPTRRHHLQQLLGATAALALPLLAHAHGEMHKDHHQATGPVVKEQKPWGIAADAKDAQRTITIRMSDNMRFNRESHFEAGMRGTVRVRA